ncbi:hypothetical protein [Halalkalibacter oceani]|uniref:hypothetical protein n=1 Tax=Halalkalibacter oceani TaxID=1653776 RepID=UPI003392D626
MKFKLHDKVIRKGDPSIIGYITEVNYLGEKDLVLVRFDGGECFVDVNDIEFCQE